MFKSRQLVNFKGKDCISDVRYNLAGTDGLLDAWIIPVSEEFIAPLLLILLRLLTSLNICQCPHKMWSVAGIFHTGEVGKPHGG